VLGAYRLPISFDTHRLLADLDQVESKVDWLDHPDYTVAQAGDWTAVALLSSASQDYHDPESLRYRGGGVSKPTAILTACPYLTEVLASFKTEIHRARLMNLRPGKKISEHRDYGAQRYSLERGYLRVHIPLRTHNDVHWRLRGQTIPMQPGEAWYLNVCEPHSVENASNVHRVHLVLDMKVNDWVRSLFPAPTVNQLMYGFVVRNFEPTYLRCKVRVTDGMTSGKKVLGDLGLRRMRDALRG
jgi:hypothetical protein